MKILTITGNNNYGNRLQNYAVQQTLKKYSKKEEIITIKNNETLNNKRNLLEYIARIIKHILMQKKYKKEQSKRAIQFKTFDKNINLSKKYFKFYHKQQLKKSEYIIVGSDQVWNPNHNRLRDFDLALQYKSNNKLSFSASFGINELPEKYKEKTAEALKKFKAISVREDAGKKIVEELTGRKDVEVLIDPTMLLNAEEWDKVSKKPDNISKGEKYILNYFLGQLSPQRKAEIDRIAKENNCKVINILDKDDPFYVSGPSEFLYLEKNAFLICTDSFHSCVFAILYDRPFVVFNREDSNVSMNSRIETLLNKFELKDRYSNDGKIKEEMLKHNYTNAYKILEDERKKSDKFLKKALNVEEKIN